MESIEKTLRESYEVNNRLIEYLKEKLKKDPLNHLLPQRIKKYERIRISLKQTASDFNIIL